MSRLRPLSSYPAATLDALSSALAGVLRYQDMLPTDLYVKLDLFRDDISKAISPSRHPSPMLTPHPAALPPRPGRGTAT
jgi:hypothetical protein